MKIKDAVKQVGTTFESVFGPTPLTQRLADIHGEALELSRFTTMRNIREEAGDLLCSLFALIHEADFDVEALIKENTDKIMHRKDQYKTLGRKIRVAVLGGAFNPPHIDHLKLAQFVLDASQYFDECWLMPCFSHLYGKKLVSNEHRLEMCKLLAATDGRIKVSDFEIANKLTGESYQVAKMLQAEDFAKNKYEFAFIIGMDNANTAPAKWVNWSQLERLIPFVVVPREGEPRDPKVRWYMQPPHVFLEPEKGIISNVSSTNIRYNLEVTDPISRFRPTGVTEEVYNYIVKHNLYLVTKDELRKSQEEKLSKQES